MHDATEGGVHGALTEMAAASGVRLDVSHDDVPILPGVLETCEFFDIDPWASISEGTLLLAVAPEDADGVRSALSDAGIPVGDIGEVREGTRRHGGRRGRSSTPKSTRSGPPSRRSWRNRHDQRTSTVSPPRRADHRRKRLRRRRGDSGRPEDDGSPRRVRHQRRHERHGTEHARRRRSVHAPGRGHRSPM